MELWLFTRAFPTGSGEAFLESALPVWAQQFDKVRVIPMFKAGGMASLPPKVEVLQPWEDPFEPMSARNTMSNVPSLLRTIMNHGRPRGVQFSEVISHARQLLRKADIARTRLMPLYDPQRVVLLSAWMEDWVTVLGLVKERMPELRFATLAHGWDLFEHRRAHGVIPYRKYQMRQVDRVICIAASGSEHLRTRFPEQEHKVFMGHLGTVDHGLAPWSPDPVLRLVSCSYLRPPKRIGLIAEALAHVRRPVHWTHFGDGPMRGELERIISRLPAHVTVELKGNVSNTEVIQWYRTNPVDLFVHCSGKEGLPVALMEAASFGIPLMASDVGGVSEVVTPRSGMLMPASANAVEWAAVLDDERMENMRTVAFREEVRRSWTENFDAARNYRRIGSMLSDRTG